MTQPERAARGRLAMVVAAIARSRLVDVLRTGECRREPLRRDGVAPGLWLFRDRCARLQTEQGPQQPHAAKGRVAQETGRGRDQHEQNSFYGWIQMRRLQGMR